MQHSTYPAFTWKVHDVANKFPSLRSAGFSPCFHVTYRNHFLHTQCKNGKFGRMEGHRNADRILADTYGLLYWICDAEVVRVEISLGLLFPCALKGLPSGRQVRLDSTRFLAHADSKYAEFRAMDPASKSRLELQPRIRSYLGSGDQICPPRQYGSTAAQLQNKQLVLRWHWKFSICFWWTHFGSEKSICSQRSRDLQIATDSQYPDWKGLGDWKTAAMNTQRWYEYTADFCSFIFESWGGLC